MNIPGEHQDRLTSRQCNDRAEQQRGELARCLHKLNLEITLIPKMTGTGGPKHFTATYGTAYDEERVGGYLL